MSDRSLAVQVEQKGRGKIRVLAPAVGRWSRAPAAGDWVGPGSRLGLLRCLNRKFVLTMPEGVAGTVVLEPSGTPESVEYGQVLFRLDSAPATSGKTPSVRAARSSRTASVPRGAGTVTAPTDGVYYGRPSPTAEPFVQVGTRLCAGQPVGLVEVMKTFHQIVYGGPGFAEQAEVLEILCEDGQEVRAGQPLIVVR